MPVQMTKSENNFHRGGNKKKTGLRLRNMARWTRQVPRSYPWSISHFHLYTLTGKFLGVTGNLDDLNFKAKNTFNSSFCYLL